MRHPFALEPLAAHLRRHLPGFGGELTAQQFTGGQSNPTYLLQAGGQRWVLRRKPPGVLLPSAHAVDREYRVMAALAHGTVPVPRVHLLCEDDAVIGTAFYVMDHVEGRTFLDPSLPGMTAEQRGAIYDEMNRIIALLHGVDHQAAGLAGHGRPGTYLKRQIERWTKQYRASETEPVAAMERLIDWLPENLPRDAAADETAFVHGDFRIDNLIFHPTEPRIIAIMDWELSTIGDPLADFAYHLMTWRMSSASVQGLLGCDLASLGLPSEDDYVRAYCARRGLSDLPHLDFYMAFCMFRLAAIFHGIRGRVARGTAVSPQAQKYASEVEGMAKAAWAQAEQAERA